MGTASGIVEATERLYRSLFTAAIGFGLGMAIWGVIIAPFNGFDHHRVRSLAIGAGLTLLGSAGVLQRRTLFLVLRRRNGCLIIVAAIGVAALWLDGGWRSSFYLVSYAAVVLASVVGGLRWSLLCAAVLAAGYVGGLVAHGYSWARLNDLHDADSVVANTGGYFLAAYLLALPIGWLGGYVARINQVVAGASVESTMPIPPARLRTQSLSAREVQVVQLVAAGLSNDEIAGRLTISPRTVQSHVANALKKTACRNRTELGRLAQTEGLVP